MEWLTGILAASGEGLTVGGVMGGLAVIIIALRKRKDVDVEEMAKRITTLEERVVIVETELEDVRDTLVRRDRQVFLLRSTLARHGIDDPTADLEAS